MRLGAGSPGPFEFNRREYRHLSRHQLNICMPIPTRYLTSSIEYLYANTYTLFFFWLQWKIILTRYLTLIYIKYIT